LRQWRLSTLTITNIPKTLKDKTRFKEKRYSLPHSDKAQATPLAQTAVSGSFYLT
jgi:hypothetical protein